MGKRNPSETQFLESAIDNNNTWFLYYDRLKELALSMFEWKNVPSEIDIRFLELSLFNKGNSVFFYDEELENYLALQSTLYGKLDVYNVPTKRKAYATNGYQRNLNNKDSVIIFNNLLHTNSQLAIEMYSKRLHNLDRIIDVNANAQKTPVLIACEDSQRLTMKNLYKQYEGNEPFIFGRKGIDTNSLSVLQTGAPYVCDKIYELKTQIWNEALTYLGISNINNTKKERMITDEVTRNQGGTVASRYSRLESRREACRKINKMFGLNMWCDYREDYQNIDLIYNETTNSNKNGGVDNE